MKPFVWRWLAVSSLLLTAVVARAETRPRYGGTLHITTQDALTSLDPSQDTQPGNPTRANIMRMIFETLVVIDGRGHAQPGLAISWQSFRENRQWHFRLRPGVKFHDGALLTAENAAPSLRTANPSWHVTTDGDSLDIEQEFPDPALLEELAFVRNAICHRQANAPAVGTGPFRVTDWQSGKRLSLAANEDYWGSRPFLDSIEIEADNSYRDQLAAFQSGKADVVEVAPEQAQRLAIDRRDLRSSLPIELLALVFTRDPQSSDERLLRQALVLSIDRTSMAKVLLQGAAQPTGSLLPGWISGYAFVFSSESDLTQARRNRDEVRTIPTWTLSYDSGDPLSRLIAERIALNAKDGGLSVRPVTGAGPDLRLVRIPLESSDPSIALASLATFAGLTTSAASNDPAENLYLAEQKLLASERIIPLFHLPIVYAVSPAVENWNLRNDGRWDLANTWLESKP